MIDIRYHVISLMAVFFALAIGIMIGSSVAPGTATRLTEAVRRQSEKVDSVLAESARDHAVLGRLEQALATLTPSLTHGKLAGKRVAIIQTGDQAPGVKAAADAIVAAGGTVASTTIVTSEYDQLDDEDYRRIRAALVTEPVTSDPDMDLLRPIAQALRHGAPEGGQRDASLTVLKRENLIEASGDYASPVTMVVFVGGAGTDTDMAPQAISARETGLIEILSAAPHMTIVGCETEDTALSSIAAFRNANVSTVDCIDRAIGKLDLVYALMGEKANYGIRATADRVLPAGVEAGLGRYTAPTSAPAVPTTNKPHHDYGRRR